MKEYKRITLLSGHYGSGKTNVALNMAYDIKRRYGDAAIADLDIVNPYFRTKDSASELEKLGIRLICSDYANSNVDIPALPQDMYTITANRDTRFVIDVGGDDRGALALGRIAEEIKSENNYEMLMVINKYRPLTPDAESTAEVMAEIVAACRIPFTGLVNNSNLGVDTTAEDVLASMDYANKVASLTGVPLIMTAAEQRLYDSLRGKIDDLFALSLQKKLI